MMGLFQYEQTVNDHKPSFREGRVDGWSRVQTLVTNTPFQSKTTSKAAGF